MEAGKSHWLALARPWLDAAASHGGDPFGPREPLRSLRVGGEPATMRRTHVDGAHEFTASRLSGTPPAFLLRGYPHRGSNHS